MSWKHSFNQTEMIALLTFAVYESTCEVFLPVFSSATVCQYEGGLGEPVPILCDSSGSYSRDYSLDQSQILISHIIGEWKKGRTLESIREDASMQETIKNAELNSLYPIEVDLCALPSGRFRLIFDLSVPTFLFAYVDCGSFYNSYFRAVISRCAG